MEQLTLDFPAVSTWVCRWCGGQFPEGRRSNSQLCSKKCLHAERWANCDQDERKRESREWYQANAERLSAEYLAAQLAAKAGRRCQECGSELPPDARWSRKFCSRRCINVRSIREKSHARMEAKRRYYGARVGAGVSVRDWTNLKRRHGGRCFYCGASGEMTMDHVVPVSRGGQHAIGNILPACMNCNSQKSDRLIVEWRAGIRHRRKRHTA